MAVWIVGLHVGALPIGLSLGVVLERKIENHFIATPRVVFWLAA